jgi:hypothetical protein
MKKTIVMAVLGVAASVATSYGQGYIQFSSYAQTAASSPVSVKGGSLIAAPYTAALYYAFGTVSDPVDQNSNNSITAAPVGFTLYTGANATAGFATSGVATAGFFDGGQAVIPGYTSATGAITFEVVAYNGADYASSGVRGRSGSFTMTSIRTDGVSSYFGDNGTPMPAFVVTAVPEPTTLALAGLGGLASLVALRRKQA